MRCAYQCHEVGGPWIAENPDCPVHNREAVAQREEDEERLNEANDLARALVERVEALEARLKDAEDQIESLKNEDRRIRRHAGVPPRGMLMG